MELPHCYVKAISELTGLFAHSRRVSTLISPRDRDLNHCGRIFIFATKPLLGRNDSRLENRKCDSGSRRRRPGDGPPMGRFMRQTSGWARDDQTSGRWRSMIDDCVDRPDLRTLLSHAKAASRDRATKIALPFARIVDTSVDLRSFPPITDIDRRGISRHWTAQPGGPTFRA